KLRYSMMPGHIKLCRYDRSISIIDGMCIRILALVEQVKFTGHSEILTVVCLLAMVKFFKPFRISLPADFNPFDLLTDMWEIDIQQGVFGQSIGQNFLNDGLDERYTMRKVGLMREIIQGKANRRDPLDRTLYRRRHGP